MLDSVCSAQPCAPCLEVSPCIWRLAVGRSRYDYLVRQDADGAATESGSATSAPLLTPVLIEVNSAPQVGDPQSMPSLKQRLGVPMINGTFRPYNMDGYTASSEQCPKMVEFTSHCCV